MRRAISWVTCDPKSMMRIRSVITLEPTESKPPKKRGGAATPPLPSPSTTQGRSDFLTAVIKKIHTERARRRALHTKLISSAERNDFYLLCLGTIRSLHLFSRAQSRHDAYYTVVYVWRRRLPDPLAPALEPSYKSWTLDPPLCSFFSFAAPLQAFCNVAHEERRSYDEVAKKSYGRCLLEDVSQLDSRLHGLRLMLQGEDRNGARYFNSIVIKTIEDIRMCSP